MKNKEHRTKGRPSDDYHSWARHASRGIASAFLLSVLMLFSCHGEVEHTAEAIREADSLPLMHACGINTLISDSGVMRYRLVAEEWDIYSEPNVPATWKFLKGLLMERFDENFHVDLFVQADTAYLYKQNLWELRGRVRIRNVKNDRFLTEELFWDMETHEMWNHQYMHIITPERELEGTEFRSNEQMTKYSVSNSAGAFPVSDTENTADDAAADSTQTGTLPEAPKTPKTAAPKTPPLKFDPHKTY